MSSATECRPSVHTKSLTAHPLRSVSYRDYLLARDRSEMDAVQSLYQETNEHFKSLRLADCRTKAVFMREISTGLVKVSSNSCHVRFCPLCSNARAFTIRTNTEHWLSSRTVPKFLTLTLKHQVKSLSDQLCKLYDSFQALRRIKLFKKCVHGGIWFFEIKPGKDGLWHPHLHIVLDAEFIPQAQISEAWNRITTDSPIVDIRQVKDPKKMADYVAKYAVKPILFRNLTTVERLDILHGLRGRRLCGCFGTATKARLTSKPVFIKENFQKLGSWRYILNFRNYDNNAKLIYESWIQRKPLADGISLAYLEELLEDKPPPEPVEVPEDFQIYFDKMLGV